MTDTIFARSSGQPPAAIAVIRISGKGAGGALAAMAGHLPEPRRASLRTLHHAGQPLDEALILWFPGPATATGEDCAEIHCHGGRAVTDAIEAALGTLPGLRQAAAGEFTRRAFLNGRLDLAEAEGLADLLAAETEFQRRAALEATTGRLSREVAGWRDRLLVLAARLEAVIDFSDEDDVDALGARWEDDRAQLASDLHSALARPPAERLRDGVRVVLAGPTNAGKSSLFNALLEESVAIVTPMAGTTRDAIERPVAIEGIPIVLVDTAGLRDETDDEIERMGMDRARAHAAAADIVLWLGDADEAPAGAIKVASMSDLGRTSGVGQISVSAMTGEGLTELIGTIVKRAREVLPAAGVPSLNVRQRAALGEVADELELASRSADALIVAEHLRIARVALDKLTGHAATEDMLDALFGRFCIGK